MNSKSEIMSRVAKGLKLPHKSDAELLAENTLEMAKVVHVAAHGDEHWTWNVEFGADSGIVGLVDYCHTREDAQRVADAETVRRIRSGCHGRTPNSRLYIGPK